MASETKEVMMETDSTSAFDLDKNANPKSPLAASVSTPVYALTLMPRCLCSSSPSERLYDVPCSNCPVEFPSKILICTIRRSMTERDARSYRGAASFDLDGEDHDWDGKLSLWFAIRHQLWFQVSGN
jgi:hypothetical protein